MKKQIQGCSVPGCGRTKRIVRSLCSLHYQRLLRNGGPLVVGTPRGDARRWLLQHVHHVGEACLKWPFSTRPDGLGRITIDGKSQAAHRAMCVAAHGAPPSPGLEAAHSCGNAHLGCVHPGHLRWATPAENFQEMMEHGTIARGERNGMSRLGEDDVRQILRMAGRIPRDQLAERFETSVSNIGLIQRRKTWAWLELEAA